MKLEGKKELAARALGVGVNRIRFNNFRLNEIKDAITKQDMRDLVKDGAIGIHEVRGRLRVERRETRRRGGSIRKKIIDNKQDYMQAVRKLRRYLARLKQQKRISSELLLAVRKEIRTRSIYTLAQLRDRLEEASA